MTEGGRFERRKADPTFRDAVVRFVTEEVAPNAGRFDRDARIPTETISTLAGSGLLASTVPMSEGGRGIGFMDYGFLHEMVGRECSSVRSLITVHDMVAEVLHRVGGAPKETWLPGLISGESIAAFALTEPKAGSDASAVATVASRTDAGYSLSGRKRWISFGQIADVFLVVARLGSEGPVGAFMVPTETRGLEVTPIEGMLGMRASMLASIEFQDCQIPETSRIGPESIPSGLVASVALSLGRYSVAWGCVGIGSACLEASYERSESREQFGVPIKEHQLVKRRLTDMATEVRAARLLCEDAGALIEAHNHRAVEATLMAKYYSSRVAVRAADHAVQIHGAEGVHEGLAVERYFRDARIMEIIEGSTEIQQVTIPNYVGARLRVEKSR